MSRLTTLLSQCGAMATAKPRSLFNTKHMDGDLAKLIKVSDNQPLSGLDVIAFSLQVITLMSDHLWCCHQHYVMWQALNEKCCPECCQAFRYGSNTPVCSQCVYFHVHTSTSSPSTQTTNALLYCICSRVFCF